MATRMLTWCAVRLYPQALCQEDRAFKLGSVEGLDVYQTLRCGFGIDPSRRSIKIERTTAGDCSGVAVRTMDFKAVAFR